MRGHRRTGIAFASLALLVAVVAMPHAAIAQVADRKNHYILECDDDCVGTVAVETAIGSPKGIATDADGNVYFSSQNIVFKLRQDGSLVRFAGTGEPGYSGDGGSARRARLNIPLAYPEQNDDIMGDYPPLAGGVAVGRDGTVYIADGYNHRIRRVGTDGRITTVADALGAPIRAGLVQSVAIDGTGNLYFGVYRRNATGVVDQAIPSSCAGHETDAGACGLEQVAVDSSGAVFFSDALCRVRKWDAIVGAVTVVGYWPWWIPPGYQCGYAGDGGSAAAARARVPYGIAIDADGQVYFTDVVTHCVRKVDRAGIITRVAGVCRPVSPIYWGWWMVDLSIPFEGDDGPATSAQFLRPMGVAVDHRGNIYIADTGHNRVRVVTPDGIITTVAGNGRLLPATATVDATGSATLPD
jgi:sugar lactone lactonase YvrE